MATDIRLKEALPEITDAIVATYTECNRTSSLGHKPLPNREAVVDNRAREAGRGSAVDVWNVARIIDRGYGFATFYNGDVDPDRNDPSDGIQPHFFRPAGITSPSHRNLVIR